MARGHGLARGREDFVDDRLVSTLPRKFTVSTGSHRVRVEASGFEPITRVVSLMSPTERRALDFRLEPARAALVTNGARVATGQTTVAGAEVATVERGPVAPNVSRRGSHW